MHFVRLCGLWIVFVAVAMTPACAGALTGKPVTVAHAVTDCGIHSTSYDPSSCCNVTRDTYNTIICGRSKSASEAYCENAMDFSATHPQGAYVAGSRTRYRIRISEQDMSGCFPAGLRELSVSQEISPGTDKPFAINSHVVSVTTDYARTLTTTISAPYDCGVDQAGAEIRVFAQLTWLGRKGWKAKPDSVLLHSKPKPVC